MLHPLSPPPLPASFLSASVSYSLLSFSSYSPILPPPLFLPLLFPLSSPTSSITHLARTLPAHPKELTPSFLHATLMRLVNKLPPAMHYGCVSLLYRQCRYPVVQYVGGSCVRNVPYKSCIIPGSAEDVGWTRSRDSAQN